MALHLHSLPLHRGSTGIWGPRPSSQLAPVLPARQGVHHAAMRPLHRSVHLQASTTGFFNLDADAIDEEQLADAAATSKQAAPETTRSQTLTKKRSRRYRDMAAKLPSAIHHLLAWQEPASLYTLVQLRRLPLGNSCVLLIWSFKGR